MKKRVINVILFGALALASTSTFVSCKDNYGDDIANLQEQMEAEKLKSTTLEGQIESVKTALENELKDVKSSYATQIAEAKAALQASINEKADAATVTALAERIVKLEEGLSATTSTLAAQIAACDSAIESINAAIANKATVAELNAVKAKAAADLAALTGDVDKLVEQLNKLSTETGESISTILTNLATLQAKDAELAAKDAELTAKDNEILAEVASNYQKLLTAIATAKQEATDAASALITKEEAARIAAVADLQSQITTLQAFQAAIESANFQQQITDLETALANYKAEIEAKDFQGQIDGVKASIQTIQSSISELTGKIAANEISITNLQNELATVNGQLATIEQTLSGQISSLSVLIEKSLTSLVFKPSQYIYGFGTINVQSFSGCVLLNKSVVTNATYGNIDEYLTPTTATPATSTWAPSAHAKYHMNPSTADITKYDFTFADVETQNALTRANDEKKIGATAGQVSAENGTLDIELKIAYPENLNDAVTQNDVTGSKYAWVSTLALQATEKNTEKVITSDYALVCPSYYGNLCLANNQASLLDHRSVDNKSHHIRTSALQTIIDANVTFEVPYNSSLDLSQYIETHYGVSSSATGTKVGDKAFTAAEFEASGLKYNYSLVSYKTAARQNQASIAEIDDAGVTKVQGQDAQYIGETYVVRILLQDGNTKNLAVGYVKVLVVDQGAEPASVTSGIALNCDNPTTSSVAMSEFVDQFKESYSSSLTIADFKNTKYRLDPIVYADKSTNPTAYVDESGNNIGQFLLSGDNLVLSLTSAEAKELFYKENVVVPQTIKVYAKFAHQADGYSDLWVEYTIDKDKVIYAQGTFTDADKIKAYWYELNSKTPATAGKYEEIHANVSVPESSSSPNFNFNVFNTFVGGKAHITGIDATLTNYTADPYADLTIADNEFNKREVIGASGIQYKLEVAADHKTLSAYKADEDPTDPATVHQNVVVLSDSYNGLANYQTTDYAKDILNYAPHTNLAEDQTFTIEILMEQNRNCYNVELSDNTFKVKFLRPINAIDLSAPATTDAVHGGGYWYVQNLVEFTDWRDYKFNDYGTQFYSFYGVRSNAIVPAKLNDTDPALIENATTDINGSYEPLADVAPGIALRWDATATNSRINGMIKYVNNGATVNTVFHIKVPMAITYIWGTIYTEVTLTITPTINQRRK